MHGTITNCYSIGDIDSTGNSRYLGGISGYNANTTSCYSKVNIASAEFKTKSVYVGGILGSGSNIKNTLSIGDIYSRNGYARRINGGSSSEIKTVYAYDNQRINGFIKTDQKDGATLLSLENLQKENTYKEIIGFNDCYEYNKIDNGILPKLYNTEGTDLLPNQIDNQIYSDIPLLDLETIDEIDKKPDSFTAVMTVYNPDNVELSGIEIEDMKLTEVRIGETTNGRTRNKSNRRAYKIL